MLAFFVANLALLAGITSLLAGIFYTVASAVGVASASILLEIALQQASPQQGGRRLMATTAGKRKKGTATKTSAAAINILNNNKAMVDQLLTAAQGINR